MFQKAASELELRKKRELQRNEFQPPKTESEDETDDELENDVDLTKYVSYIYPTGLGKQCRHRSRSSV